MFNKYFDSVFNCHQCSVSIKRMIVVATDAILPLRTGLTIRTIARRRPSYKQSGHVTKWHINIVDILILQSHKES